MEVRNAFSELGAWLFRKRRNRRPQKEKGRTLRRATEAVVGATDPRIRQVRGYREKLGPAVQEAMRFADELVEALPGPIEIGRDTWATDPYVRAFFTSVDEMLQILRLDRALEAFFQSQPLKACYALLTMSRREQTVFRTEQVGEIIRRDVAKTAVSFVDHRIVSTYGTEAETRAALKVQTLAVLSDDASQKLVSLRSERDELQDQKAIMKARLKVLREESHDSHPLKNCTDEQEGNKIREAMTLLTEIDSRIEQANLVLNEPEGCLAHVADVLSHPLDNMKKETITLRLSPMGIKEREGSPEANGQIFLTEIELRRGVRRIPVVAKFKRTEVLGS
jgi:hypothetical protein